MQSNFVQIEEKINLLVSKLEKSQNELLEYKRENEQLKNQLNVQNDELKNFKNREKISKIVGGVADSDEKGAQLKHKINEYIREIDKCIAYLSLNK
jgi:chromosome segregation ATPase